LTLLKSSIRKKPLHDSEYVRKGSEDDRFIDYFGSLQSIVTSTGREDSGMFEVNLRDERFLPFEGAGVISEWRLELAAAVRQFDYDTISDVILHFRYTAREGGEQLRGAAVANLTEQIDKARMLISWRLFSIRHEFPTEWARFKSEPPPSTTSWAKLTINLREEHYPFWSKGRLEAIRWVNLFARTSNTDRVQVSDKDDGSGILDSLYITDPSMGSLLQGGLVNIPLPPPTGQFTLFFDDTTMDDLWIEVKWGKGDW
jgi:hypothetical protein